MLVFPVDAISLETKNYLQNRVKACENDHNSMVILLTWVARYPDSLFRRIFIGISTVLIDF